MDYSIIDEIQTFAHPENSSAENRKCIKQAPDIKLLKKVGLNRICFYLDI